MRKQRKLIAVILTIAVTLNSFYFVFADNNREICSMEELEHCFLWEFYSDEYNLVGIIDKDGGMESWALAFANSDFNYSWTLNFHLFENYGACTPEDIKDELLTLVDCATLVEKNSIEIIVANNSISMLSSAWSDLYDELEDLEGNEYDNRLKYGSFQNGLSFNIYESLMFDYREDDEFTFRNALTVADALADMGENYGTPTIKAICKALGLAISATQLIPAGTEIKRYRVIADYYRFCSINGSSYMYSMTDKFHSYYGYDNITHGNLDRAYIDTGSRSITYSDSRSYFNSYSSQVADAYSLYQRIGQRN